MRNTSQSSLAIASALLLSCLTVTAQSPNQAPSQTTAPPPQTVLPKSPSAGHDIGSGTGDIGKGAAGGVGNVAKGTGKGAVDLVTLHPINAAGNVGKGAAVGAKDVGIGAAKGTGKIAKGTGKAVKHIF